MTDRVIRRSSLLAMLMAVVVAALCGCGQSEIDQALDSDANGYYCTKCQTRFYTARSDFAQVCPECKQPEIEQVIGYVCTKDNQVMLGPRGSVALRCSQCGGPANGRSIPREADLKAWGAAKRSMSEVSRGS